MKPIILPTLFTFCFCFFVSSSSNVDEIKKLPGLKDKITFRQYSGYLSGGKGKRLFYWFVESQNNPSVDPVVLWLNGGPGCSSVEGLLTENGPFRVAANGKTLNLDPYSWNTFANVLYLESPINVGFSYNTTQFTASNVYNDEVTVNAKYNALINFFKKYPHFKLQKFYITGESYAGVYIPLLTRKILENRHENGFNLKGIAIGNGFMDLYILEATRVEYAYYHGLFGLDYWNEIQETCCRSGNETLENRCDFPLIFSNHTMKPQNHNKRCALLVSPYILHSVDKIDRYYIYNSCNYTGDYHVSHFCPKPHYNEYLNKMSVRKALHVDPSLNKRKWNPCNKKITKTYHVLHDSMETIYNDIVEKQRFKNIILYTGDADLVFDFLHTQHFLEYRLKYSIKRRSHPWFVDGRYAGIATSFWNGVRFFSVHGAGHKVSVQKPKEGYLDGGNGYRLFYWFVESQNYPSEDPVVLWLNGGPGCSSIAGLLTENGPFRVAADGTTLNLDPYSWNAFANVLYLESPVNVGFSYNTTKFTESHVYNDEATVDIKYNALINFFEKYPYYKKHDFYITGESYAGVYIPLLTQKILKNRRKNGFNLKGIAIGNGFLDMHILAATRMEYGYFHGLIGLDRWNRFQKACCRPGDQPLEDRCDFPLIYPNITVKPQNHNLICALKVTKYFLTNLDKVDPYDIYNSCNYTGVYYVDHFCKNPNYAQYLNQATVREALHVDPSLNGRNWSICNKEITKTYNVMHDSMGPVYKDIVRKYLFRNIVLYNGDTDLAADFVSAQHFLEYRLKFYIRRRSKPWFVDGRFAGIVTKFWNGIHYYSVHGAGHMVPTQKPEEALAILKQLLSIKKIKYS